MALKRKFPDGEGGGIFCILEGVLLQEAECWQDA